MQKKLIGYVVAGVITIGSVSIAVPALGFSFPTKIAKNSL